MSLCTRHAHQRCILQRKPICSTIISLLLAVETDCRLNAGPTASHAVLWSVIQNHRFTISTPTTASDRPHTDRLTAPAAGREGLCMTVCCTASSTAVGDGRCSNGSLVLLLSAPLQVTRCGCSGNGRGNMKDCIMSGYLVSLASSFRLM